MPYGVKFIGDDELPEGHDFAMVRDNDDTLFFIKRSKVTPQALTQAWAAYRALPGTLGRRSITELEERARRLGVTTASH